MSALTNYPKAAIRLLPFIGGGDALPSDTLTVEDQPIDRDNLTAYQKLCGFAVSDTLPATYPHLLAFGLSMDLMTRLSFPFGVVGLVHVENAIERLRPIGADERLDLAVRAADLRPHPRGRQFDIVATAASRGEEVWRSRSSYLHRESNGAEGSSGPKKRARPANAPPVIWSVPEGIGRAYGAVSGDRNPIHIHALTAKLFGFPRAIAHGMWVKARCLGALESRTPESFELSASFKLPLPIPGRAGFDATLEQPAWKFGVVDAASGKPHLSGTLTPR